MNTPIYTFIKKYGEENKLRLHMPGHKGEGSLGVEKYDITEVDGADSLYNASGIIAESESNASGIFGSKTYYSTEGSSLSIRAMLYLVLNYAKENGENSLIFAGRNAHKSFISAVALLDIKIKWLYGENDGYLSCKITPQSLENALQKAKRKPLAVYLTSPDYLGNVLDIENISKVCKKYGVLLLVDNAHGGYLKFLETSLFPIDLGADVCCSSAHKTLPVLTGGGYLHISNEFFNRLSVNPKDALSLFGSTSPSYLIMASLDLANLELSQNYRQKLATFINAVDGIKKELIESGYALIGNEPIKITLSVKSYGYDGYEFNEILKSKGVISEFYDPDFVCFMVTPNTGNGGLLTLKKVLLSIPRKEIKKEKMPTLSTPKRVMGIRKALFSVTEELKVEDCVGKILASPTVFCPPAVPIVSCGEIITENAVKVFKYYGINTCVVVKE